MEAQLAARMGRAPQEGNTKAKPKTLEDELFEDSKFERKDDSELAPSWVAGITEVPLSLDQRLKNIEETELAKKAMLAKSGISRQVMWSGGMRMLWRTVFVNPLDFNTAQARVR